VDATFIDSWAAGRWAWAFTSQAVRDPGPVIVTSNQITNFPEAGGNQKYALREPDHPDTVTALDNIVDVLYREHRYAEAAAILSQAVDAERSVLGTDHPHTFHSLQ
jgi:hypothetical protein